MIKSLEDYRYFLKADSIALRKNGLSFKKRIRFFFFPDYIWKFQRILRKYEYYKNTSQNSFLKKVILLFVYWQYRRISLKMGFSIPANVFGPGLSIAHYGTIIVNHNSKIGANCRLHACVNIGASGGDKNAPKIGDNVYIGPGAKIFGDITIPCNTAIGANSVVNKTIEGEFNILAGIPVRVIRKIDRDELKRIIPHINI